MPDERLDKAAQALKTTQETRKEISKMSELTDAIMSRYKVLPGILGSIGQLFRRDLTPLQQQQTLMQRTAAALHQQKIERAGLHQLYEDQDAQIQKLNADIAKTKAPNLKAALGNQLDVLKRQLDGTVLKLNETNAQFFGLERELREIDRVGRPAAQALQALGDIKLGWSDGAVLLAFRRVFNLSTEMNRSLINANSSLVERNRLLGIGYRVGLQTGASTQTLMTAQAALVDLGLEMRDGYEATLKTTVKLVDGLGLGADEAAQLAVTARAGNVQFSQMANTIAGIVNKTSLAANEAARYARMLTQAAAVATGPGGRVNGANLTSNLRVVAQVEGALKGTMAQQGELANLLTRFSSITKEGGLGMMLGTGGTDFLARDAAASERVLGNIARAVRNSSGMMLEMQAQIYGVSTDTLGALGKAYREQGAKLFESRTTPEQREAENFQKRYNEQMGQTGQSLRMLGDRLLYLGAEALNPIISIVNTASQFVIRLTSSLSEFGGVVEPFKFLVTTVVIGSILKLSTAFYKFVSSTIVLAESLNVAAKLKTGGVGGIGGTAAGMATEGLLGSFMNRMKGGAALAGAEAVGANVAKGALTRVTAGLLGWFEGGAIRMLLGRVLGMVGMTVFTGGWGLLISVVGSILTLLPWTRIWASIKSVFSGSDKSNTVNADATTVEDRQQIQAQIQDRADEQIRRSGLQDRPALMSFVKQLEDSAIKQGASLEDLDTLRQRIIEAAKTQVEVFAGAAQRRQGLDADQDNSDRRVFAEMNATIGMLTDKMSQFADDYRRAEVERVKREAAVREDNARRRAADSASRSNLMANLDILTVMQP